MSSESSKPASKRGVKAPIENIISRIKATESTLSRSAKKIAAYVLKDPQKTMELSITELAEAADVSEGSVINFCRTLGLSGFQQFKLSLAGEIVQPIRLIQEDLERDDGSAAICEKIFSAGEQALRDTRSVLDLRSLEQAVKKMRQAKRVEIYGIGSAAHIAQDAYYRMMRIGVEAKMVLDSHMQAISASRTDKDVVTLTISHSGATIETVACTKLAQAAGATTVVITNFAKSPIIAYADIVLYTMARETKFRTEAMTSRIAQLCVVDTLIAALAMEDYDRSTATLRETFDVLSIKRY